MTELEKKQKRAAYAREYKKRPEVRAKNRILARAWASLPEQKAKRLLKQTQWRAVSRLTEFGRKFVDHAGRELRRGEPNEPPMVVYPLRMPSKHLDIIRYLAKHRDRTRQSLIREAVRQWIIKQVGRPNKNTAATGCDEASQ